jgi:hypothetical protein
MPAGREGRRSDRGRNFLARKGSRAGRTRNFSARGGKCAAHGGKCAVRERKWAGQTRKWAGRERKCGAEKRKCGAQKRKDARRKRKCGGDFLKSAAYFLKYSAYERKDGLRNTPDAARLPARTGRNERYSRPLRLRRFSGRFYRQPKCFRAAGKGKDLYQPPMGHRWTPMGIGLRGAGGGRAGCSLPRHARATGPCRPSARPGRSIVEGGGTIHDLGWDGGRG